MSKISIQIWGAYCGRLYPDNRNTTLGCMFCIRNDQELLGLSKNSEDKSRAKGANVTIWRECSDNR